MNRIEELDKKTVGKIAAGEVIERPASIVKELVENSIDAGATIISVEIKEGGKSYIRVTDNGSGIVHEDLELAFKRHSTSKLKKAEDLYNIHSLGFRGEALASISAVSRVKLMTKTKETQAGLEADIQDGLVINQALIGAPQGSTFIIRDLFYNLPVRKEFLKSDLVESNRISDIVYKLALGHPHINFNYIKDDKLILKTNANSNMQGHIYSVLGREISDNIIEINHEEEGLTISGYISNNHYYRGNRAHQYIFLNKRFIRSQAIARVIENQYKSLIPINKYPVFILFIDLDPAQVDVNIHPSKQEVKFSQESRILDSFTKLISSQLHPSVAVDKISLSREKTKASKEEIPSLFDLINQTDKEPNQTTRSWESTQEENSQPSILIQDHRLESRDQKLVAEEDLKTSYIKEARKTRTDWIDLGEDRKNIDNLRPVGVVFNTFIIAQDSIDERLYFIDQHAAHERVMYEKYIREYNQEDINIQMLLSPQVINLTNHEMENTKANLGLFRSLGFDLEEFGPTSIIIRGIPILFGQPKIENLFYNILDQLEAKPGSNYQANLEKIMKLACVNSVKSGDQLDEREILALFQSLKACQMPYTCPHGRPTMLEMTRKDLEKEFLRII